MFYDFFVFLTLYSVRTLVYTEAWLRIYIYMCPTQRLAFQKDSSSVIQAKFLLCEEETYPHLLLELLPKADEVSVKGNASGAST